MEKDVKPEKPSKITLKVQFIGGEEPLVLRVKATTTFQKIYNAVANARNVAVNSFRLRHDGQRIQADEKTPADLNFDEEEILDYHVEQLGGKS